MAHELTIRANNTAEMAYAGETPWHGLGQTLQRGATIEQWQVAAGMDWRVQRSTVRYNVERGQQFQASTFREFPEQQVLFRSDTKAPLGVVSPKFQVVQPGEVLEFFRDLVGSNGIELETAGTLFGGRRFWALATLGEGAVIGSGADLLGGYVLLSTGADGTFATTAKLTTVRVVCNNTLSMALGTKDKHEVRITHRSAVDMNRVKNELGLARGQFSKFVNAMRELSRVNVSTTTAGALTANLLAPELYDAEQVAKLSNEGYAAAQDKVRNSKQFKSVMDLFNGAGKGANLQGAAGTAWGWVNAVTEHVDHHAAVRIADKSRVIDNRLNSAWFGKGDDLKTEAVELAMAMV